MYCWLVCHTHTHTHTHTRTHVCTHACRSTLPCLRILILLLASTSQTSLSTLDLSSNQIEHLENLGAQTNMEELWVRSTAVQCSGLMPPLPRVVCAAAFATLVLPLRLLFVFYTNWHACLAR